MAKFCTKCGRPLKEGEVSECANTQEKVEVSKPTTNSVDIKESFMDCLNVFKNILTKPFEAMKEFVTENKYISGIIMIIVAALSTGIYKLATLKSASNQVESSLGGWGDLLNSFTGGSAKPDYFKEFLTETVTNLAQYAVLVLLGYLIISKLMNGKATWKHMVNAVGISLSLVICANLINSILVFIDGNFIIHLIGYVSSFASVFSVLLLYGAIQEISEVDKNKLFVRIAAMFVCASVVVDLVQKIFS